MRKVSRYQCETCGEWYDCESDALACEAMHRNEALLALVELWCVNKGGALEWSFTRRKIAGPGDHAGQVRFRGLQVAGNPVASVVCEDVPEPVTKACEALAARTLEELGRVADDLRGLVGSQEQQKE